MKVMMIRKADSETEKGVMPSNDLLQAMADYNEKLMNAGVMEFGNGLKPSSQGVRIDFHNGVPSVIDGPFAETKELLAGYTIINVESMDEAIAWAKQWPVMDSNGNVKLELRAFYSLDDFVPGDGLEKHKRHGERLLKQPKNVSAHLSFNGDCREAMTFYAEVLCGEVTQMVAHGDMPDNAGVGPEWQDKIIHAEVNLGGRILMGADAPTEYYQKPAGVSVQLEFDEVQRGREVFDQLLQGGSSYMPFGETPWAKGFGMLTDRYGTHWMINAGRLDI